MAQDLTKLTVVMIIVGVALAIATFRPQILPPVTPQPSPTILPDSPSSTPEPEARTNPETPPTLSQDNLEEWQARLTAWETRLETWEATLGQLETTLAGEANRLANEEAQIDARLTELEAEEAQLNNLEAKNEAARAEIDQERAELEAERNAVDRERTRLRTSQVRLKSTLAQLATDRAQLQNEWQLLEEERNALAARIREVEAHARWSLISLITSGGLALFGAITLIVGTKRRERNGEEQVERPEFTKLGERLVIKERKVRAPDLYPAPAAFYEGNEHLEETAITPVTR